MFACPKMIVQLWFNIMLQLNKINYCQIFIFDGYLNLCDHIYTLLAAHNYLTFSFSITRIHFNWRLYVSWKYLPFWAEGSGCFHLFNSFSFFFLTHFVTKLSDGEWNQLLHHIVWFFISTKTCFPLSTRLAEGVPEVWYQPHWQNYKTIQLC